MTRLIYTSYLLLFIFISGCSIEPSEKEGPAILEYDNLIIYSDLSSRMNRSPNDSMVINQIIEYFLNDCVKPGIKINDRSSITFSRVNFGKSKCPSAKIDISSISNLEEKQRFVNSKTESNSLATSILDFKQKVRCNYKENDEGGLDLLSLIYNEVNAGNNIKKTNILKGESDSTILNYHNRLFIFTDGYLEYAEDESKDFYFGEREIEKVRQFCKLNKVTPEDAIKNNSDFKLRPLKSENNKFVTLYVLETGDRGLNIEKGTIKNTGDLSDNNVLRLVWKTWAEESGFKNLIWKPMTQPSSLPNDYIKTLVKS